MELVKNPFFSLGATMRDSKRHILELAEEKILVSDETATHDATALLTNPRRRLAAEIGWMPGLGPKRISDAISILERDPIKIRDLRNLPTLARANLLADGFVRIVEQLPNREVAQWIVDLAIADDVIQVQQTVAMLNEERSLAGFPAITDLQVVAAELHARSRYYRQAIDRALDQLPAHSRVEVVTIAVDQATDDGDSQSPNLIDELVDSFAVNNQRFLETERQNIAHLVQGVRDAVERDEADDRIDRLVSQLEEVVKNWDRVAQPIQVSARSRGKNHDLSHKIAQEIRSLAVYLNNEHGLLDLSRRLTILQQEVFAEIDRIVEQLSEDTSALEQIADQKSQNLAKMEAQAESWKREITYEADVGAIFKHKLRISPEGVLWKGSNIPLEEIQRVRWGATRHSLNGIPTGTTYTIFVGREAGGATIELRKQPIYSEFVDRLWKTAGVRLLTEMLQGLRAGKVYIFGTAILTDYGVELERRKLFPTNELVSCKWTDLVIGNGAGTFYIAKKDENKVTVEMPYQEMDNIHILEAAMRVFWKNATPRLSDLLDKAN